VLQEAAYSKAVAARLQPPTQEAVSGNPALAIKTETAAAAGTARPAAAPENGREVFRQVCSACHGAGIAGAPKAGDRAAWAARVNEGNATLDENVLKGFQGKGGRADLPDELVKQGVDHMLQLGQ
jgi:cytochrome c5